MAFPTQNVERGTARHEVIYSRDEGGTARPSRQEQTRREPATTATLAGGSVLELLGGGAAAVLAIIGLTGYLPTYMTAIATITAGGGLLAHGASVAARWADTVKRRTDTEQAELAGGMGSEVLGGAAGITLGIIALAGIAPTVLLAVAAIVLGGSILIGGPAQVPLARLAPERDPRVDRITYETVEGTSSAMVLVGAGAAVLGILALIGTGPALTLVLVSMLGIGGVLFLEGGALSARFGRRLQQTT